MYFEIVLYALGFHAGKLVTGQNSGLTDNDLHVYGKGQTGIALASYG